MSAERLTISLPDGRKQSGNDYLKLLVHFLHEHTIDDLREQTIQDRQQFNNRFLSLHRIRRRQYCSTFLLNLVENTADKKQLEIVTQLENLRSAIENAYRRHSTSENIFAVPIHKLVYSTSRPKGGINRQARVWAPETVNTFEQFGGLYVLLDLLFLDHRLRNLEPQFVTPAKPILKFPSRRRPLSLINWLIYDRDDVKVMFLKSEVLLTLLADYYRQHCVIDVPIIRIKIVQSFKYLAEFKNLNSRVPTLEGVDFGPCGIVTSLTEVAVASHAGSDDSELIDILEAIYPLVDGSRACRGDFLAVEGSMDMLIDLFDDHGNITWYHPDSFHPLFRILLILIVFFWCIFGLFPISILLFFSSFCLFDGFYQECQVARDSLNILSVTSLVSTISLCIVLIVNTFLKKRAYNTDRKCELAGQILVSIGWDLHTNEQALERFRQRDACRLLVQYIQNLDYHCNRYFRAISILSRMISGPQRPRMGDSEVERRRLRELNVERTLRYDWARYKSVAWDFTFNNIITFFQDG